MTVYATVGYPGSGKGEAATVARQIDLPVVSMGDEIRAACRARGLVITEENLGRVATAIREREGIDAIARRCLPLLDVTHRAYGDVLIDGIRGHAEVERFQAALGDEFTLIAVLAPFETRLERIRERNRDPSAVDAEALSRRDERERGYGMDAAIDVADHRIDNTASLGAFHDRLRAVLTGGDPA